MKTPLLSIAVAAVTATAAHAKSDLDVYLTKVMGVTIEERSITISGDAVTRITTISPNDEPGYRGPQLRGHRADVTHVAATCATFTLRCSEQFGPEHQFWQDTLAAAEKLKRGEPTGRIAFYTPAVTIKANRVTAVDGHGLLMANPPKHTPPGFRAHDSSKPFWVSNWYVYFSNGVRQTNRIATDKAVRSTNTHGWAADGSAEVDEDGRVVITYQDDRIERLTQVNHQMVVEHWHPAASYPEQPPVVGIAKRVQ